jgi:hypothetical protein
MLSSWHSTSTERMAASGKPTPIWHALNGVRYNDTTINTNSNGQIAAS